MLAAVEKARRLRGNLAPHGTDALRIVDGSGDALPGIEIDEFAGHWLVQTRDATAFPKALTQMQRGGALYWKRLGENTPPIHIAGPQLDEPFVALENGLKHWIDFTAPGSPGLFIDQRENRRRLRQIANSKTVLNCFAYTCAFGLAAAAAGAATVNLDLSKRYLVWGRRNYELNGLDAAAHDFIYGDVQDWLRRFAKKGRRFDVIILDPPTFSRSDKGRVFTVEQNFPDLARAAREILEPAGTLFCSTNQRTLSWSAFRRLIEQGFPPERSPHFEPGVMPRDFTGERYLKAFWVK